MTTTETTTTTTAPGATAPTVNRVSSEATGLTQRTVNRGGSAASASVILDLRVRNHPGVMSHITGLFARRAFNLEAILCVPDANANGAESRMLLLVADTPRLAQIRLQLGKLHDVLAIRARPDLPRDYFARLAETTATVCEPK